MFFVLFTIDIIFMIDTPYFVIQFLFKLFWIYITHIGMQPEPGTFSKYIIVPVSQGLNLFSIHYY